MRKPNSSVTHEKILYLLEYDPRTGIFIWKNPNAYQKSKKGCVAGRIDSGGYRQIAINKLRYGAHRLAWLYVHGRWPEGLIDHINLNKDDNRIENLRECSLSQNCCNRRKRSDNTTGFKGIFPENGKFRSEIVSCGERINLGSFETPEEAHAAYVAASLKYHGEFGRGN